MSINIKQNPHNKASLNQNPRKKHNQNQTRKDKQLQIKRLNQNRNLIRKIRKNQRTRNKKEIKNNLVQLEKEVKKINLLKNTNEYYDANML